MEEARLQVKHYCRLTPNASNYVIRRLENLAYWIVQYRTSKTLSVRLRVLSHQVRDGSWRLNRFTSQALKDYHPVIGLRQGAI
jgi:hypothetical protein